MGNIYSTVVLSNAFDEWKAEEGLIPNSGIRSLAVEILADSGAIRLAINEEIRNKLGLKKGITIPVTLANGEVNSLELVSGIRVGFEDRSCLTDAFVLPGNAEPLLGAIPMEAMDLVLIPSQNRLATNPAHPNGPVFYLK